MEYSFDVNVAKEYGLEEAILLHNICYWCLKNASNNKHFYDGKYWTYNSARAYSLLFPFWNQKKVERIIQSLKEKGLIETGNYNEKAYDRTAWYTPTELSLALHQIREMHSTNMGNGNVKNVEPIPINTNIKTNVLPDEDKAPRRIGKKRYGTYKNVILTDDEYKKLNEKLYNFQSKLEYFSEKKETKGYKYNNDYLAILNWKWESNVNQDTEPRNKIKNMWEK